MGKNIRCIIQPATKPSEFIRLAKTMFENVGVEYGNDGKNGLEIYGFLYIKTGEQTNTVFFSECQRNSHLNKQVITSGDIYLGITADANDTVLVMFQKILDVYQGYICDERQHADYILYSNNDYSMEV
jgi:hypothetical protein